MPKSKGQTKSKRQSSKVKTNPEIQSPNTNVVRPFKVAPFLDRTRLKPRTTSLDSAPRLLRRLWLLAKAREEGLHNNGQLPLRTPESCACQSPRCSSSDTRLWHSLPGWSHQISRAIVSEAWRSRQSNPKSQAPDSKQAPISKAK